MALTANLSFSIQTSQSSTLDLGTFAGTGKIVHKSFLTASAVTKQFQDSRTLTTTETLDLTTGLTDPFGTALVFTNVKGLVIENTGAAQIVVGGGSNAVLGTDQYTVKAGKCVALDTVFAVDGTHKSLLITASGLTTYSILVVGN